MSKLKDFHAKYKDHLASIVGGCWASILAFLGVSLLNFMGITSLFITLAIAAPFAICVSKVIDEEIFKRDGNKYKRGPFCAAMFSSCALICAVNYLTPQQQPNKVSFSEPTPITQKFASASKNAAKEHQAQNFTFTTLKAFS